MINVPDFLLLIAIINSETYSGNFIQVTNNFRVKYFNFLQI